MGRFKPSTKTKFTNGTPPPWLGFQDAQIISFEDKSNDYNWADLYLELKLNTKGSEYPVTMNIAGQFDRDDEEKIIECSLTRKLYSLFNAIGFGGGPDEESGKLLTAADDTIEDVSLFFNNNYAAGDSPEFPYTIYVYKVKVMDKTSGEEKVWTRVDPRMAKTANAKQLSGFMNYIKWAKENAVITEYIPTQEERLGDDATSGPWDTKETTQTSTPSYRANK